MGVPLSLPGLVDRNPRMPRAAVAAACLLFLSCGSGPPWTELAGKCNTADDQRKFLLGWTDDVYLWYREVPPVDPVKYADPLAYFGQLKTLATTPSGKPKDQFHFTYPTAVWQALSQSGQEAGYGATWVLLARTPPRKAVVAYNEPNTPAVQNNLSRGVEVLTVDGVDLVNAPDQASVDTINAGMFPAAAGEQHTLGVRDLDGTLRTVTMISQTVTSAPVQNVHSIPTATGKVGYMLFNDHLATAESALIAAVNQLKGEGISDLVVDIRYNGGGFLAVASELAYMIAGPAATSGKTFERLVFNDKHPRNDPVTGATLTPAPFFNQTVGLPGSSVAAGTALPTLGLGRVFVLTGGSTCSASEAVLNGLSGVDVQVIQIGAATCGKPYGFYPLDNCGTTFFSIQFQGVNAKGFGEYADGFTPGGMPEGLINPGYPGCPVSDDFGHLLGDAAEARLATALTYRDTQSCGGAVNALTEGGLRGEGEMIKPAWRQNRIVLP